MIFIFPLNLPAEYNHFMESIVEVKNLVKRFGSLRQAQGKLTGGFTAVDDISFSVHEGEIVGLLGRNGAGKTTTISLLLGLLKPTDGTITVFGKNLETHRVEILTQTNFSSAYIELPSYLNPQEILRVFAYLYDIPQREKRIDEVIELFELKDLCKSWYMNLSSGQQTRIHLAKAFLNKPRILYLDEPTASLDPVIADMVRKLLVDLQKKLHMTVLITSHNMAEVEEVCDRVLFIDHGKLIAEDTPEGLAGRITKTSIRLMIKDGLKRTVEYCNKHKFDAKLEGRYVSITLTEEEIVYFLTFLAEREIKYQEISIDRPTLEDFFLLQSRKKI